MINIKVLCDSDKSWQFGFQDPVTPILDTIAPGIVFGVLVCVLLAVRLLKDQETSVDVGETYAVKKYENFYHAQMQVFGKPCSVVFVWTNIGSTTKLPSTAAFINSCYHSHPISQIPHTLHFMASYSKVLKVMGKRVSLNGSELVDSTFIGPTSNPKDKLQFIVGCLDKFHHKHGGYPTHSYRLRSVLLIMEGL